MGIIEFVCYNVNRKSLSTTFKYNTKYCLLLWLAYTASIRYLIPFPVLKMPEPECRHGKECHRNKQRQGRNPSGNVI